MPTASSSSKRPNFRGCQSRVELAASWNVEPQALQEIT